MPDFNPYEALGVGRKATPDAIKRADRKKARSAHPDRAGGNADQMADIATSPRTSSQLPCPRVVSRFSSRSSSGCDSPMPSAAPMKMNGTHHGWP